MAATVSDTNQQGASRLALAVTAAGACLWLAATALTVTQLGVVVGIVVWVWGVPAVAMAVGGLVLWCRAALVRRRCVGSVDVPGVGLAPAAS